MRDSSSRSPGATEAGDDIAGKHPVPVIHSASSDPHSTLHPEGTSTNAQNGVQQIEAIAAVWPKRTLILAYVLIWVVYFVMLMQQATAASLAPFVTSEFRSHPLTSTVGILSSVLGGVCNLTVAKILDVFGRPQGYSIALLIATIGLIMMAATTNVEMYAAAQVFWTVGNTALLFSVNIFVADTTALHNRGLMTALTASPNIVTTWLGGPISEAFLKGPGWRWAFGLYAIIVPVLCLPLFILLSLESRKATKKGLVQRNKSSRTLWQSFLHYSREFDVVGLLLLTGGIALFLLPLNLWATQSDGWRSPLVICMLVFGIVLVIAFILWEHFFAPITFIPLTLLLDRNVIGACVLGAVLFISFNCWNSYFSSFLQVVNNLSVTEASYVVQIYGLGSSLFTIVAGVTIQRTGRCKHITLYAAIPIYALFMGLMIHFRNAGMSVGYIIMCQIFLSFAAGIIIITPPIAAMSSSSHQRIAVVVSIVSMFSSIGGAIGFTTAGAIWQSVFPAKLLEYLPIEEQVNFLNIYGVLEVQLSYPVGSPARIAIQHAYADAQSMMLTAGTVIWVVAFVAVAFWTNPNLKKIKQVEGQVI